VYRNGALVALAALSSACSPATLVHELTHPARAVAVPICRRAALGRGLGFSEGGGGAAVGVVEVTNIGPTRCAVDGIPRVRLLSGAGRPLAVTQHPRPAVGRRIVLGPGERAQARLAWANYCTGPHAESAALIWRGAAVPLRPAAKGWMSAPRCDDPATGSRLTIGRFSRR
jgi:Protein of unknown function (DUF4232)